VWTSKNRRWTRAALDRERADFFDTRVTGRAEIWQTLHAILQVLWDPEGEGAAVDDSGGLATAQSMLDAAEITLPTGNLAHGAYDNFGNYYAFHEWIISDPVNIVTGDGDGGSAAGEGDEDNEAGLEGAADSKVVGVEEMEEILDDEEAVRRREEKGKAVVDVRDLVTVCARLSENSRDIRVSVGKGDAVRLVARKILEESGVCAHPVPLPPLSNYDLPKQCKQDLTYILTIECLQLPNDRIIRIAYMGKMLKDNLPLQEQGWVSGHIINALVFPR
jgi:hypothetical protein